jgi:hypothetical protein
MNLPTLYFLTIRYCGNGDWGIFETHCGQEKGCIMSNESLLGWAETEGEAVKIAENWEPLEGVVDSIGVEV